MGKTDGSQTTVTHDILMDDLLFSSKDMSHYIPYHLNLPLADGQPAGETSRAASGRAQPESPAGEPNSTHNI